MVGDTGIEPVTSCMSIEPCEHPVKNHKPLFIKVICHGLRTYIHVLESPYFTRFHIVFYRVCHILAHLTPRFFGRYSTTITGEHK